MAQSERLSVLALVVSCIFACFGGGLTFCAAPIVMLMYNASLRRCLWLSFFAGLALDAITLSPRFGFLALSYLVTCQMLYPMRLYFFKDSFVTLPVMTFLFSIISQGFEVLIALFFDISLPHTTLKSLFSLALMDAAFATAIFLLPSLIWHLYRQRIARRRYSEDS